MNVKALKFTKNHKVHGISQISRKWAIGRFSRKANFTENVTAVKSWIRLVPRHNGSLTLRIIVRCWLKVLCPVRTYTRTLGPDDTVVRQIVKVLEWLELPASLLVTNLCILSRHVNGSYPPRYPPIKAAFDGLLCPSTSIIVQSWLNQHCLLFAGWLVLTTLQFSSFNINSYTTKMWK